VNAHMTKFEIAKAIERRNEEITREARERRRGAGRAQSPKTIHAASASSTATSQR
jgi:hypothetical protein